MAAEALATALSPGGSDIVIQWLTNQMESATEAFNCSRSEFVTYFICYLRTQTESILQTNENALQILHQSTPEKLLSQKKCQTLESEDTSVNNRENSIQNRRRSSESPSKDKSQKKTVRRVKTKLFNDSENLHQTDHVSSENVTSSTPMKNNSSLFSITSPVTPIEPSRNSSKYSDSSKERCDTPRMTNSRYSNRTSEKSINLGDYITNATKISSKKKKHKTVSAEITSETKTSLDLNNSEMFPEIGAKRRIKPTNIDSNSTGSNFASFSSDFQQPSLTFQENSAFKHEKFQPKELSNSFNTERSILKQERHKLMEKFNILNISSPVKIPVTPQVKVLKSNSVEPVKSYIEGDKNKITFVHKLDAITDIYDALLKNNLILSIMSEIYFMISVILSKQCTEDYELIEIELNNINDNNICDYLLKSLHNSSYVAVKSLWNQKHVLEIMLDKFSLKLLGENKRVRSFSPELAKHLLNLYSLKCEGDGYIGKEESGAVVPENRLSNGIVCFNSETDSVENFPSVLSFQNFKKQRDMFYEILRWWSTESVNQSISSARTLLRSRVKSLLSLSVSPANHTHLARLFVAQLLADCVCNTQESKLSKLQRRLTGPTPSSLCSDSNRLPRFTSKEQLYRDMLLAADSDSFRAHARDVIACELCSLNAGCMPACDERLPASATELRQDYLASLKRLRVLAKFLGLLLSSPYGTLSSETAKSFAPAINRFAPPKEKVLKADIAVRDYYQPPINIQSILEDALHQNRLSVTIPWLVMFLAMLDFTSYRIRYYDHLLRTIFTIHTKHLSQMKKSTEIFVSLCLAWLFDMPHFPQERFYEVDALTIDVKKCEFSLDSLDLVDENVLAEVCPYLKELNVLLLTSSVSGDKEMSSFRHITPVTMSLNSEARAKNKERELQARLEQEYLRGLTTSTRRVLELVTERVTSATLKELSGIVVCERDSCRPRAVAIVLGHRADTDSLLKKLQDMYAGSLSRARGSALRNARARVSQRTRSALRALLPGGGAPPLETLAAKSCLLRVEKWLDDNWNSVGILCKDIEAEMRELMSMGAAGVLLAPQTPSSAGDAGVQTRLLLADGSFNATCVSPAEMIMDLKETICQYLEYGAVTLSATSLAERALVCCRSDNVFVTATTRKAVLQLTVEMLVVLVSRSPDSAIDLLLNKLDALWNECCPNRQKFEFHNESDQTEDFSFNARDFADDNQRMATPISSEDEDTAKPIKIVYDYSTNATQNISKCNAIENRKEENVKMHSKDLKDSTFNDSSLIMSPNEINSLNVTDESVKIENKMADNSKTDTAENESDLLDLFNRILCPRNVVILSETRCECGQVWTKMADVLVFLMRNNYLSEDSLTEQCLAVYRQDWPQKVLECLSVCMRRVSSHRPRASGKFTLLLDFLAEFCGEMD